MYWATFDCYGTLIDWNGGLRRALGRAFGESRADDMVPRYHEVERQLQADGRRTYRQVLTDAMALLGADAAHRTTLADSLPEWPPFPEARTALLALRAQGWKLAILSNTDPDYLDASIAQIGVPIDLTVVASAIGSYKPAHRHWDEFFARTGADRSRHVHVAASLFHDIAPAACLELRAIWINRLGERSDLPRFDELPDLSGLPVALAALRSRPERL